MSCCTPQRPPGDGSMGLAGYSLTAHHTIRSTPLRWDQYDMGEITPVSTKSFPLEPLPSRGDALSCPPKTPPPTPINYSNPPTPRPRPVVPRAQRIFRICKKCGEKNHVRRLCCSRCFASRCAI